MNDTWIKLYRKILQNDALFRSAHTFTVWCWLLLMADKDTGVVRCGRFQISHWLKIKPSTVYLTLQRLQNLTMIDIKPNNKMTTIYILNWDKYQSKPNNNITTNQQQSNTIQEERIKNIYTSNESSIFSYFGDLKEDNKKIIGIATEFDIRPKDVIYCVRDMLSKSSEKNVEIKNVKAKLNTWINNSIRWHKVATITAKEQDTKPIKRYKDDIDYWMKEEGIRIITGKKKDATKN